MRLPRVRFTMRALMAAVAACACALALARSYPGLLWYLLVVPAAIGAALGGAVWLRSKGGSAVLGGALAGALGGALALPLIDALDWLAKAEPLAFAGAFGGAVVGACVRRSRRMPESVTDKRRRPVAVNVAAMSALALVLWLPTRLAVTREVEEAFDYAGEGYRSYYYYCQLTVNGFAGKFVVYAWERREFYHGLGPRSWWSSLYEDANG